MSSKRRSTHHEFCDAFRFTPLKHTRTQAETMALYKKGILFKDDDIDNLAHRLALFFEDDRNDDVIFGSKKVLDFNGHFRGDGQNHFAIFLRTRRSLPTSCKELQTRMLEFAKPLTKGAKQRG